MWVWVLQHVGSVPSGLGLPILALGCSCVGLHPGWALGTPWGAAVEGKGLWGAGSVGCVLGARLEREHLSWHGFWCQGPC